jgi:hypothetical protein
VASFTERGWEVKEKKMWGALKKHRGRRNAPTAIKEGKMVERLAIDLAGSSPASTKYTQFVKER